MKTPLYKLDIAHNKNQVYIKREDLYPYAFGGNKARIAIEYIADMKSKGCDCLIGYGNSRSNLNRALAFLAAQNGVAFHVVSPSDDDGTHIMTFNSKLAALTGAVFHECSKSNVAETVTSVLAELKSKGHHPYYIYGNEYGKGNEEIPVRAYVKTYYEIKNQSKELGVDFDYIFLATGTGMTLAGLLVSQMHTQGKERIVGISVARNAETADQVVQNYCDQYCVANHLQTVPQNSICVVDNYRCGGYGKSCAEETQLMSEVLVHYGFPLDPTYTGKAFWGMKKYLSEQCVIGKNVLFLHTGGTPLFYDWIGINN